MYVDGFNILVDIKNFLVAILPFGTAGSAYCVAPQFHSKHLHSSLLERLRTSTCPRLGRAKMVILSGRARKMPTGGQKT